MKLLEFRKLTTKDIYDNSYDPAWSRTYEYPWVINVIQKYCDSSALIHNSSWGFEGVHVIFKDAVESHFPNTVHSDIKPSNLPDTFVYDITKSPASEHIEKYDVVVNISTMEEIPADHVNIFANLFKQVKEGGVMVVTFDLPGLQLDKFEKMFSQKIISDGECLSGKTSKSPQNVYSHLNVGVMVVQKMGSEE